MKLKIAERKTVTVSSSDLVHRRLLQPGLHLPWVVEPALAGVDLFAWVADHRKQLQSELLHYGAILFRGFPIKEVADFHHLVTAVAGEPLEYKERSSPRSQVAENIYTSTDYPANESIFPHNEHSYSHTFPLKLFFWCDVPAQQGGETPLGDTRRVYRRIPGRVRERFAEKGWMFVRNFNTGFGLPWQTVFQTSDRKAVESYCEQAGIEWEWRSGDQLRTRQVRPAAVKHPSTGEMVWFNHATFFHVTTLKASVRDELRSEYGEEDLPNNTFYGDGTPIPDETMALLRDAYTQEMIAFPWQAGDVVMIDNMLTAHARAPFVGPRRTLVAMAEAFQASSLLR